MKVRIEKAIAVPAPAQAAWAFLRDVPAVAGCMPGARIEERIEGERYKGSVAVKLGVANLTFKGDVEMRDLDEAARSLRLLGRGTDASGTSGASMDLLARVEDAGPEASRVVGTAEVTLNGKVATFGGRMANAVADQVLVKFGANFAEAVVARRAASAPVPAGAAEPAAPPAPVEPLNGFAVAWAAFKQWLRGLFAGKAA